MTHPRRTATAAQIALVLATGASVGIASAAFAAPASDTATVVIRPATDPFVAQKPPPAPGNATAGGGHAAPAQTSSAS